MKYLVFNVTVFLALAYLVIGQDVEPMIKKATMVEKAMEEVNPSKQAPPALKQTVKAPIPPVESVAEEKKVEPKKAEKAVPPPLPAPVEVAKVVAKKPKTVPSLDQVHQMAAPETLTGQKHEDVAQELQSAKERSRQLRDMAAEMEQMFAEKMTW